MKTLATTLLAIILLASGACTRNDGDIGKQFGQWKLVSISRDGADDPSYKGNIYWSFQNSTIEMKEVTDEHEAYQAFGSYRISDNTMFLSFTDPGFPAKARHRTAARVRVADHKAYRRLDGARIRRTCHYLHFPKMVTKQQVLVTGADGFIGSHLTELLLERGYKVRALAQYNSFNNWGWLEQVHHPDLEVVCGDVRDPDFCRHICKGVETAFHLAALIAIPYSYVAPDSYVDTNIKGTLNMCQAARDMGVGRLLVTSTSEVYGTALEVPITEKHPRQPQSPYSATKIGADAIAMSFYNAFSLPVTIVRPFNTFGPRQSARAIIPTVITQIAAGQRVIKVGDLTPTRDFNYVRDTARGFLAIAQADPDKVAGQEINIATQREVSMEQTLRTIASIMGVDVEWVTDPARLRPSKSEVRRLLGSAEKLNALTGWKPEFTLEQGLERTIAWFTDPENLKMYKSNIYNQ